VKKKTGIFMTILLSVMMIVSLTACQKSGSKDNEPSPTDAQTPTDSPTPEATPGGDQKDPTGGDGPETEELRMKVVFPEGVTPQRAKGGEYAENDEYLLYAFYTDTVANGALYGPFEIVSFLNTEGNEELAKEVLRLKDYEISTTSQPILYENINGMQGLLFPFSKMTPDVASEKTASGEGFAMIYGRSDEIGAYVVLGVIKDSRADTSDSHKEELSNLLKKSAYSLIEVPETAQDYVVFRETMDDGTVLRAAYGNGRVNQVEKQAEAIRLYYDEDHTGYILIRHEQKGANVPAEEFYNSLKDNLMSNEDLTLSDEKTVQGKKLYHQVSVSYQSLGQERLEILSLTADGAGSVWIIDLCGTPKQVHDHEDDLRVLLWSLEEE